jgi:hypothetical protein
MWLPGITSIPSVHEVPDGGRVVHLITTYRTFSLERGPHFLYWEAVDLRPILVRVEDLHEFCDGLLVVAGAPHYQHPRAEAVGVGDGYLWAVGGEWADHVGCVPAGLL